MNFVRSASLRERCAPGISGLKAHALQKFDDYLIPEKDFDKLTPALPLPVSADYHEYITSRMTLLQSRLEEVNAMAALGELPDVEISDRGVKVSPAGCVPARVSPLAELVYNAAAPKITEILDEVNSWTTFTRHFSHIKMTLPVPIPDCSHHHSCGWHQPWPDQNGEACPGAPNHHSKIFRHGTS
jgi:hypothetical protein